MQKSSAQAGPDLAVPSIMPRQTDSGMLSEVSRESLASQPTGVQDLRAMVLLTLPLTAMVAVSYVAR